MKKDKLTVFYELRNLKWAINYFFLANIEKQNRNKKSEYLSQENLDQADRNFKRKVD